MREEGYASRSQASSEQARGIAVTVFGQTDVGLIREHNEDNFIIADLTEKNRTNESKLNEYVVREGGSLFAVCDGMGGAAAGEVASRIAIDTIYEELTKGEGPDGDEELARRLESAISEAGKRIFAAAKLDRQRTGMGTTVTAAVMIGPRLLIGQVGDSRAYIARGDTLIQVTKDQSLVQQLLDAKQITEEEARNFDRANIILQALGTSDEVHVDVTSVVIRRGDVLIMCSDGLSGPVSDEAIYRIVHDIKEPEKMCRQLTDLACLGGGHDNITVIVARFDGDGLSLPAEDDNLVYRQFKYSTSAETTVRAAAPVIREHIPLPPRQIETIEWEQIEDPVVLEDEVGQPLPSAPSIDTGTRRIHKGVFAGASTALAVGLALVLYIVAENKESGDLVSPRPIVPASSGLKAAPVKKPAVEENKSDEPRLAPTPEEALSGRSLKRASADQASQSARSEVETKGITLSTSRRSNRDEEAVRDKKLESEKVTSTVTAPVTGEIEDILTSESTNQGTHKTPQAVSATSDNTEPATVLEDKKKETKSEKGKTAKTQKPRPIDDNPF